MSSSVVWPAAGRLIQDDDDRAGAAPVAVLSAGYSQRRFGDAGNAIGQAILINSVPFTVIGVAPAEFFGVDPAAAPQIYFPMRATSILPSGLCRVQAVGGIDPQLWEGTPVVVHGSNGPLPACIALRLSPVAMWT